MSYTQIRYHIIFSTKNRLAVLCEEHRRELYNYLWGILKNKNCHLDRVGGVEDHIHLLTSIHQTIAASDLLRDLKSSSSTWIKKNNIFPGFLGWQNEYGAFTKSKAECPTVINYIQSQKEHHKTESSIDEFKRILMEEGISFDEKYLL